MGLMGRYIITVNGSTLYRVTFSKIFAQEIRTIKYSHVLWRGHSCMDFKHSFIFATSIFFFFLELDLRVVSYFFGKHGVHKLLTLIQIKFDGNLHHVNDEIQLN